MTRRMRSPMGEIRLKGQSRALSFPNYLIANPASEFDFFKDNKRFTCILVVYTSCSLIVLSCSVSHQHMSFSSATLFYLLTPSI